MFHKKFRKKGGARSARAAFFKPKTS